MNIKVATGQQPTVDAMPMQSFRAILEDLHAAIGSCVGVNEPTRQMLLGRIDGYRQEFAIAEPSASRQEALDLIYAAKRAAKLAERMDLTVRERKDRMRETLGEYLRRPKRESTTQPAMARSVASSDIVDPFADEDKPQSSDELGQFFAEV